MKTKWIDVRVQLPAIDEYVLWLYDNGSIIHDHIDKDWNNEFLQFFLSGGQARLLRGRIIAWMHVPEYPNFK